MDSIFGWIFVLVVFISGGVYFAKACIDGYEEYLENRRHGW
jgi:hypothetical protein